MNHKPLIVIAAAFPPPVHGASTVTLHTEQNLINRADVVRANTSPGILYKSLWYHFSRSWKTVQACYKLLRFVFHKNKSIYISVAGGLGNLYSIPIVFVGKVLGYRVFLDHHSFSYINRYSILANFLFNLAGRGCAHAALSNGMAEKLKCLYKSVRNVRVVSNAARIIPVETKDTFNGAEAGFVIGHLSNLTFEKGLGDLLATFKQLYLSGADVSLFLAGPAAEAESEAIEKASLECGGAIRWLGPVYGAAKTEFYENIDLFLFPSRYANEAQPLVLFESLAHGVPVIATARGCIEEDITEHAGVVIQDNENFSEVVCTYVNARLSNKHLLSHSSKQAFAAYALMHSRAAAELERWLDDIACKNICT